MRIINESKKQLSVELSKLMSIRLIAHVREKADNNKKNHWCWKFTKMSIPVVSAIMILTDYVTSIDTVHDAINNPSICPLSLPTSNNHLIIENKILKMEGCYLCFDTVLNECVRSGKASRESGDSFRKRLDNHRKGSCLTTLEHRKSLFCMSHPTGKMGLKGKYEHLKPHCAMGFDSKERTATDVIDDDEYFTCNAANSYISSAKLRNDAELNAKITLISYLVECCFDALLSKQHNVSESPGCKKVLKQFGRRQE